MRLTITVLAFSCLLFLAGQASARPCASYATIESYDQAKNTVTVDFGRGRTNRFFPKPEGATGTKIPSPCRGNVTRYDSFEVRPTGGRMTITQVRTNFTNRMLNEVDDPKWLGGKLQELIDGETEVVIEIREGLGKDDELYVSTIYLPASEEDYAEIKRLEEQAVDE